MKKNIVYRLCPRTRGEFIIVSALEKCISMKGNKCALKMVCRGYAFTVPFYKGQFSNSIIGKTKPFDRLDAQLFFFFRHRFVQTFSGFATNILDSIRSKDITFILSGEYNRLPLLKNPISY